MRPADAIIIMEVSLIIFELSALFPDRLPSDDADVSSIIFELSALFPDRLPSDDANIIHLIINWQ